MPLSKTPIWCAASLLALTCVTACADPGYYVVTAYSDPGLRTVDLRYWTVDTPRAPATLWPELGLGWNVDERWYTGVLASYVGSEGTATRLSTLNWQNDLVLTGGRYPVDVALHTLVTKDYSGGHALEFGPALQTDVGRTQLNFNLFFARAFGAMAGKPTQLKYQWQARYRWMPALHVGLQGFGEVGRWDHWPAWQKQSHRAGPAVFGKLPIGGRTSGDQPVQWQAAWLVGSTYAQHGSMFSARVSYGF